MKRTGAKRSASAAELVGLVSISGPPWYDEATGKQLDEEKVAKGMRSEEESLEKFGTYIWVPAKMAQQKNVVVVQSRWLLGERDNGDRVKARIVAQQLNKGSAMDTYAAAPTSVAARLLAMYATEKHYLVKLGDVSTAFLHATLPDDETVLVEPPPSLRRPGRLWQLKKAVYGLRISPRLLQ